MKLKWCGQRLHVLDDAGQTRLSFAERGSSCSLVIQVFGSIDLETETYFIDELQAASTTPKEIWIDLTQTEAISARAQHAIWGIWLARQRMGGPKLRLTGLSEQIWIQCKTGECLLMLLDSSEPGRESQ